MRLAIGRAVFGAALSSLLPACAQPAAVAPGAVMPKSAAVVVIDAPSNLGLRPPAPGAEPGVRKSPDALRATGLLRRLRAGDAGRVDAPGYSPAPDFAIGFRNGAALRDYSRTLADRLTPLLAQDRFVLVLGGDCSVLLGSGLALKQRGRYGLAFVDGHDDFSFVRDRRRYRGLLTAAGLDLGLATGHGPAALSDLRGRSPYFRSEEVVHLGLAVAEQDRIDYEVESFERSGIHSIDAAAIHRHGGEAAGREARARLEAMPTDGYWIHLDADVLAERVMPAVDSPNPDGLDFDELRAVLIQLLASPKAVGMELTIFDPDLDPDGRFARRLADTVASAFEASGRWPRQDDPGRASPASAP